MKHQNEYRNAELAGGIAARIHEISSKPCSFMEFCGGHTLTIARHGIGAMLPERIKLLSGPGCPVCVTPMQDVDLMSALAAQPGVIVTTYGDMLRVPGSRGSLLQRRAEGADVRIVYSSYDAVELARINPESQVVFFGIGFETTAPATAAAVLKAAGMGLENFSVISAHKTTSPIIAALLESGEMRLDGLVCPGHVSVVTGTAPYVQAAAQGVPCVVTGFEPVDILQAVLMLVEQVEQGRSEVEIQYSRTVRDQGNPKALRMMERVFAPVPSNWRGIGVVPESGLEVREEFSLFNARSRFDIELPETREPAGCICGRILRGAASPADCSLFAKRCTPTNPVGACMVSSEGACHAHFRFRGHERVSE